MIGTMRRRELYPYRSLTATILWSTEAPPICVPSGRLTTAPTAVDSEGDSSDGAIPSGAAQGLSRRWHREFLHGLPGHRAENRVSEPCSKEQAISIFTSEKRLDTILYTILSHLLAIARSHSQTYTGIDLCMSLSTLPWEPGWWGIRRCLCSA